MEGGDNIGNQTVGRVTLENIQRLYWSGTEFDFSDVRRFRFDSLGGQGSKDVDGVFCAWAVRRGDVAAAPEPASLALLGIGLAGLGFARRRQQR